jgi:hypothetical protein
MLVNRIEKPTMNNVVRAWAQHRVETPLLGGRPARWRTCSSPATLL